ncbi:MAG: hypothetical protein LBG88_02075 [Christensenellaceae bacterium]|jgi:hypothetical protein|nr:hypothetical protein [Christensenellaceae bacterium]
MTAFLQKWKDNFPNKAVDCDFDDKKYDMDKLIACVKARPFLRDHTNITLKSCIKHYDRIITGGYKPAKTPPPKENFVRHNYTAEEFKSMWSNIDEVEFLPRIERRVH